MVATVEMAMVEMAMAENESFYRAAERRVEFLTLAVGLLAALVAGVRWSWPHGAGVAVGGALAWINYRWLKQGISAMARVATAQAGAEAVRIPKSVYVKFFARYALIIGVVYVIFSRSLLPAGAVLGGLFALVAAVILEILHELVRGGEAETRRS